MGGNGESLPKSESGECLLLGARLVLLLEGLFARLEAFDLLPVGTGVSGNEEIAALKNAKTIETIHCTHNSIINCHVKLLSRNE